MAELIDTNIEIVTPENIAISYRLAGPFQRLPAYLIDLALRLTALFVVGVIVATVFTWIGLGAVGGGLWLLFLFALEWFYGGFFETIWNGQTPGKWLLRLRVLSVDGRPISAWQAVLRNLLRAADAMPSLSQYVLTYLLGLATTAANDRFQRLGDLACGTMVVVEEPRRRHGVVVVAEPEVVRLAADLPPNITLEPGVARALASYVARRTVFTPERRIEISRHLAEPLRQRLGLGPSSPDVLLCALYRRLFLADEAAP
ncbi:MAG: RDD family protein [Pirellulales bacterium]|nr:RDD family protein [Pirellulales bacterium]